MKVLICGEGAHDIGESDAWSNALKEYQALDGWLQPLVRRLLNREQVELSIRKRRDLAILRGESRRLQPLPKGHGAKALIAKRAAILGGFDAVIFMVDADDPSEARWKEICAEVAEGFARVDGDIVSVICVPRSASESWLLSDLEAWQAISGQDVDLPAQPECIWGARDDPEGNHPHRLFSRLCARAGVGDGREVRVALAEVTDINLLAQRCPVSFVHFRQQMLAA